MTAAGGQTFHKEKIMKIYENHKPPQYESKKCCFWCGKYSKHGEMVPNMILGKVFKCNKCTSNKA